MKPVEYSQTENGNNSSAPQPVVKEISDRGCVTGRRGISAEYSPNENMAPANIKSPLLN